MKKNYGLLKIWNNILGLQMADWIVYWMDGGTYRQTLIECTSIFHVANNLSMYRIDHLSVIKIERVAK